jgi:hypothetical protein
MTSPTAAPEGRSIVSEYDCRVVATVVSFNVGAAGAGPEMLLAAGSATLASSAASRRMGAWRATRTSDLDRHDERDPELTTPSDGLPPLGALRRKSLGFALVSSFC